MSQEELKLQAENLINSISEKIKQKEEKILSTKTSRTISKANTDNNIDIVEDKNIFIKQNTIENKNIKRSNSTSSSDSDSSPHDNSDDEKKEEQKKRKNKKQIKDNMKKSTASESSLENLMVSEDMWIKAAICASAFIIILTISLNIFFSLKNDNLTLTFGYHRSDSKDSNPIDDIVMNHTMIYILLMAIILFNLGIFIVVLLNNDHFFTQLIYTNLNWYFVLTQLALGFQFLITLVWEINLWTINVCLSVSMLAILILAFYFTEIKQKKNMSACTFVFIYIYVSVLFSFIAYITLFNISCILMENVEYDNENSDSRKTFTIIIKIGINVCQTILSVLFLTYYKDVFFSFTSAYIESAVFVHLNTKFENENICLLVMVVLIVVGILLMICRYKKATFGYENYDLGNELKE